MNRFALRRPGFTAIELLLAIGLITISAGMAVPVYRQYLIRSDLEIARQNISQGIQRAKFLSQVAMNDSAWGFSTDALPGRGVLFMGDSYAGRDTDFDEEYSIPHTIAVSGLTEVRFDKISGRPLESGTITLTAMNGEQRTIAVNIGDDGTVSIPEDWISICVDPYGDDPRTISVPDSLWEVYEAQGAIVGACGSETGEEEEGQSSSTAGNPPDFEIDDGTVTPSQDFTCEIRVLGAAITSGSSPLPVTMQAKLTGWNDPFGSWNMPVDANINDDDVHVYDCTSIYNAGTSIDIRAKSWEKKSWWYSGSSNSHWTTLMSQSTDAVPHSENIRVLRNGDLVPDVPGMSNQSSIEDFVSQYINLGTGTMQMADNQVIYLFELGTTNLNSSAADFQDLVVLLTLEEA
jgi:type II secretory pathway pseudopilin PulG